MRTRIFGVHRRIEQRQPSAVALGGVVAVEIAVTNGANRAPEVVRELGVENGDQRVVRCDGNDRERSCIAGDNVNRMATPRASPSLAEV
ncbi:MAG TPA: hypothetical protein VFA81_08120 [Burkholderiales bacterium]|nr:hypothetical protein [Burkholderiales bacterium]